MRRSALDGGDEFIRTIGSQVLRVGEDGPILSDHKCRLRLRQLGEVVRIVADPAQTGDTIVIAQALTGQKFPQIVDRTLIHQPLSLVEERLRPV